MKTSFVIMSLNAVQVRKENVIASFFDEAICIVVSKS